MSSPDSTVPVPPLTDLPDRIVVGANGAYWRDYGDHYSMCPVSTDNDPVEIVAIYNRQEADATAWDRGFKAGLDAARASAPVSVAASSPGPLTALPIALDRLEAYINGAPGDPDDPDFDFTTEDREFICEARYALAALPVREDEPTGIDE